MAIVFFFIFLGLSPRLASCLNHIESLNQRDESNSSQTKVACNLFDGVWVKDNSRPLWNPTNKLVASSFSCKINGRKDDGYMKWRWRPSSCSVPRFSAADFLRRMRNRRIAFVGDSLAKNQIYSLAGMLTAGTQSRKVKVGGKSLFGNKRDVSLAFIFTEFNVSLELYSSAFLVKEIQFPKGQAGSVKGLLDLNAPSPAYESAMAGVDLIIFNTGHWFNNYKLKQSGVFPVVNGQVDQKMAPEVVFKLALKRWAAWADSKKASGSRLVFRSFEPVHGASGPRKCPASTPANQNVPLTYHPYVNIARDVVSRVKKDVIYLDVSKMSALRNDAHTFVPGKGGDCSHWCTPGVPDEWNLIMIAEMRRKKWKPFV